MSDSERVVPISQAVRMLTTGFDDKCECGRIGPTVLYTKRTGADRGCALVELSKMQTKAFVLTGARYEGHVKGA